MVALGNVKEVYTFPGSDKLWICCLETSWTIDVFDRVEETMEGVVGIVIEAIVVVNSDIIIVILVGLVI